MVNNQCQSAISFWTPDENNFTWYFKEDLGSIFDEDSEQIAESFAWLSQNLSSTWSWIVGHAVTEYDARVILYTRILTKNDALFYRLSRTVHVITTHEDISISVNFNIVSQMPDHLTKTLTTHA
jgi:hypothetical protein